MGLDESLVELRPLTVLIAHHSCDNEKHHLTHRSATSTGKVTPIKGGPCLFSHGSPTEIRFERASIGKIENRPNGSENAGSLNGPQPHGTENLPCACLLDNGDDRLIKLLGMGMLDSQFCGSIALVLGPVSGLLGSSGQKTRGFVKI